MRFFYQSLFQPLFTQIAPGASRVEDYVYSHDQEASQVDDADQYSNGYKLGLTGQASQGYVGLVKTFGLELPFLGSMTIDIGRGPRVALFRKLILWNAYGDK